MEFFFTWKFSRFVTKSLLKPRGAFRFFFGTVRLLENFSIHRCFTEKKKQNRKRNFSALRLQNLNESHLAFVESYNKAFKAQNSLRFPTRGIFRKTVPYSFEALTFFESSTVSRFVPLIVVILSYDNWLLGWIELVFRLYSSTGTGKIGFNLF